MVNVQNGRPSVLRQSVECGKDRFHVGGFVFIAGQHLEERVEYDNFDIQPLDGLADSLKVNSRAAAIYDLQSVPEVAGSDSQAFSQALDAAVKMFCTDLILNNKNAPPLTHAPVEKVTARGK